MKQSEKICYVIMPFSSTEKHTEEYWTNHFNYFLKPFIENQLKMKAQRSKALVGDIVNNIITDLTTAPILIADISEFNPNVLWELGVRHSFVKNGTILIAEKGLKIPFDLFRESIHFYNDHSFENPETQTFFDELKVAVDACNNSSSQMDSPIFVAISERGTWHEIITKEETLRKLDALLMEFEDNSDYLNMILDMVKENKRIRRTKAKTKNEKTEMLIACIRYNALDLLITTHYLNQPSEFFEECRSYLAWLMGINESIMAWPYREEGVDKWLSEKIPIAKRDLKKLQSKMKGVRSDIEKIK